MTPSALARETEAAARALGRRDLLRLVALAAGAGLVPAGCGGLPEALGPGAGPPLRVLTPRTYAVLTAATMRIVGPTGADLVARRVVDAGRVADRWLAGAPAVAGQLGTALTTLELAVPPLAWKLRPFTRLSAPDQDAVLDGMMRSRWDLARRLFGGVRSLALLAFYGSPASRVVTGYPGPFGNDEVTIGDAMAARDVEW
jgi:hypothetical protein